MRTRQIGPLLLVAATVILGCESREPSSTASDIGEGAAEVAGQCTGFDSDLGPTPSWDARSADRDASAPPDHLLEARLLAQASHWVGIVDLAADDSYFGTDPVRFTCTVGPDKFTRSYVPLATFCPTEWLKNPDAPPLKAVLEGDCRAGSGLCASTIADFPLNTDRYFVFLIADCCGSQYGSAAVLRAAFPIRGDLAYFGSGDTAPWLDVKAAILAAEDSPTKVVNGRPFYAMDSPCP